MIEEMSEKNKGKGVEGMVNEYQMQRKEGVEMM